MTTTQTTHTAVELAAIDAHNRRVAARADREPIIFLTVAMVPVALFALALIGLAR